MTSLASPLEQDRPRRVLVVEDDYLVAQDVARALRDGGFEVLGPVGSAGAALVLVARRRPDAAVLDVALRDDLVSPLARTLHAMGVPFVVASAYGREALSGEPVICTARMLGKPTDPAELVGALRALLG